MARIIIKQPNGLFAMWSTIADDFICKDLTEKSYIKKRLRETYKEKKQELQENFNDFKNEKYQTIDYNECLRLREANK